jgi:hypothetical protein
MDTGNFASRPGAEGRNLPKSGQFRRLTGRQRARPPPATLEHRRHLPETAGRRVSSTPIQPPGSRIPRRPGRATGRDVPWPQQSLRERHEQLLQCGRAGAATPRTTLGSVWAWSPRLGMDTGNFASRPGAEGRNLPKSGQFRRLTGRQWRISSFARPSDKPAACRSDGQVAQCCHKS